MKRPRYLLSHVTTLHGLTHFTNSKGPRLWGWIIVMIANILFTLYLILVIKERYESDQVYTRVDSTCRINQVPFPAVSICNANLISVRESRAITTILESHNRNQSEIKRYLDSIQELTHFGYGSDKVEHFTDITRILEQHYFTVDAIMEEVHQTCDKLLLHCEFNRKVKKCREVFKLIKTLEGHCCAFNYAALNDLAEDPLLEEDAELEYYDDRKTGVIISTSKSGRLSGLTVLLNVEPNDYPPWSKALYYGAKVLISDPNDFPETTVITKYISIGESMDLKIEPQVYLSSDNVRRVPVEQRQCWFHDEAILDHTDRYSFETCSTECVMRNYNEKCGCIPYRYPRERSARICSLADVACLHNMTVIGKMECRCHLECTDKKYKVRADSMPLSVQDYPAEVINGNHINTSEAISLKVYFSESTCNCYKKSLVMDYDKLLGTYGGVLSLSIGGSILTIVEVIYLILSFLFAIFWTNYNKIVINMKQ